ncbi:MAG: OmpH family outer membrane protein [Muribaculaceae bacterium]|nr:OmpH family outer membrane protein [Muribaculaceae bacterium]
MKKTQMYAALGILALTALGACGGGNDAKQPAAGKKALAPTQLATGTLPNYRIINYDSIVSNYNLGIDFKEQLMRLQNNYDAEERKLGNSFQSRYNSFMQKQDKLSQERVQLPSEVDALQKEGEQLQNYYQQSQQSLQKLQLEIQKTMMENSQTIMDSLQNFLQEYVAVHGYEAIFFSESAPYYNPALDVTNEVVEGLNARYNKVKK